MRTFALLLCAKLATLLTLSAAPIQTSPPSAPGAVAQAPPQVLGPTGMSLISTNNQVLLEALSRSPTPLIPTESEPSVARLVSRILVNHHYIDQPFDDTVSSKFLDRYLEVLDSLHMHFLQSDIDEFEKYRTKLDNLTYRDGDTEPARTIFERFLERLEQRVRYVAELLQKEKFSFDGNDRFNLNRKDAPRPKDLAEAKALWRQNLRYEVLQEKLNKEKPEQIAKKISRRYAQILRLYQDLDEGDIFEIYLSALTHVYDPHSEYMGKSSLESFSINMSLSLYGIGALLQSEDGYCKIKELVPNGPAAKSKKLKPNDRIIAVAQSKAEPVDVVEMPLKKVVDMIRGAKGTEVRLTIIPADAPDPSTRKVITLVRDEIKLEDQEAKAKIIDVPSEQDKTVRLGVIDLPSFYAAFDRKGDSEPASTTVDVAKLLRKLKREKVDGVVLDLRRNGGGSLDEAINLTGLFINEGPVVQVKDRYGKISVDSDTDPSVLYDGPLIVLTSRFSASASEILAGALQDYGRALIVGDSSTHGKGTVQSLIRLDPYVPKRVENPGAIKLTIRKFYRASGASTQLKGVIPDIVLPSPNNYAEIGEASLDNPLSWDTIPSAEYQKLNLIEPLVPELRKRSAERIAKDQDFIYLQEDIAQYRKMLADKTVSLNEAQRLKEKKEKDAREKVRQAEIKNRPKVNETVYDITLKQAAVDGLPAPESQTNQVASASSAAHGTGEVAKASSNSDDDDDSDVDSKAPPIDVSLKEAKRILVDLISLWPHSTVAQAQNN